MDISTLYRRAPCRWVNADGEDIHRQAKNMMAVESLATHLIMDIWFQM